MCMACVPPDDDGNLGDEDQEDFSNNFDKGVIGRAFVYGKIHESNEFMGCLWHVDLHLVVLGYNCSDEQLERLYR